MISTETLPCKCCGSASPVYGTVDFHKNCVNLDLGPSGNIVKYYSCESCGFIFTNAFDLFSKKDFDDLIYNSDYTLVDPDFVEKRPHNNAKVISSLLSESKGIHILDYGSGVGRFADILNTEGFIHVDSYDPFFSPTTAALEEKYDCIVSLEVLEHSIDPGKTIQEMTSLLKEEGVILLSTVTQPGNIDNLGLDWWYISPRNGHVSIFSINSLHALVQPYGFNIATFNPNFHVLFRQVPQFAKHFIRMSS